MELISAMNGNDLTVDMGYTRDAQGGFTTGAERMTLLPTNLYLSGYVKDRSRLTLDDVVITQGQHEGTQNSGKYTFDVSGEKTLGGSAAEGDFCSIQDLKEPYSLTAFNISYPTWYFASAGEVSSMTTRKDDRSSVEEEMGHKACPAVYMYVRHDVVKKRYISRVFVGASTRDNADSTDKNVLKNYDKQVDLSAMIAATAAGSDEVIPYNIAGDPAKAWNNSVLNTDKLMEKPTPPDGGDPAAYISVARTDDPDKAIRSIVLYQSDESAVPEEIKIDRAVYYCASNTTPIRMNDNKKYYVYYSYNIGVSPGKPITELDVSEDVFYTGCSTALVVDKPDTTEIKNGKTETTERSKPYGNTELLNFIHAKYVADSVYFNKIFTASGSTVKEAQLGLLEQGCTEFCNIDLNKGAGGKYIYFGYRGFSLDEDKINENATEEAREKARDSQLSEAIYDIVCTVGEPFRPEGFLSDRYQIYYAPVAKKDKNGNITGTNLNEGTTGPEIYLYYTSMEAAQSYNQRAAKESLTLSTMPKDYLSSPLTKIGFALYDYVPYSKEIEAASSGSEEMTPWEYVMKSDNKAAANLNEGAVFFNSDHMMSDNRLTMFAQRADGNVKPSAEITGGYNTALVAESKLYNYK